jgi:hypothetical protein
MKIDIFPFVYVGGGYFRRKGVPKDTPAEILHGQEAIDYVRLKQAAQSTIIAAQISEYLLTGMHHSTPEAQLKIAEIINANR